MATSGHRGDEHREWALRKLKQLAAKREADQAATAAKAPPAKRKDKRSKAKGARKSMLMEAAARNMVDQIVTPEAQRHGEHRVVPFSDVEVTEGGKRVKKEVRVVRNLARTQIERWHDRGVFDERQMAAILFYQDAFRKAFGEGTRVTANYSPALSRGVNKAVELWANSTYAAREALRLLDNEVFFRAPIHYFPVWQNVVVWDQPAGVAGAPAGFSHKPAEAAAKVIVVIMAGMIADIVIDSSRQDFGNLLHEIDLDAPRRPGGAKNVR